jgi:hypothetical protein
MIQAHVGTSRFFGGVVVCLGFATGIGGPPEGGIAGRGAGRMACPEPRRGSGRGMAPDARTRRTCSSQSPSGNRVGGGSGGRMDGRPAWWCASSSAIQRTQSSLVPMWVPISFALSDVGACQRVIVPLGLASQGPSRRRLQRVDLMRAAVRRMRRGASRRVGLTHQALGRSLLTAVECDGSLGCERTWTSRS